MLDVRDRSATWQLAVRGAAQGLQALESVIQGPRAWSKVLGKTTAPAGVGLTAVRHSRCAISARPSLHLRHLRHAMSAMPTDGLTG